MMFSAVSVLLLISVLTFIVRPLRLSGRRSRQMTRSEANVAIYRHHLTELEADWRDGVLTADQFIVERDALEQRAVADLPDIPRLAGGATSSVQPDSLPVMLAVGVPLLAVLLYLIIGAPDAIVGTP